MVPRAICEEDDFNAQRLGYRVSLEEMGVRSAVTRTFLELDTDRFDALRNHVLARVRAPRDGACGLFIGTHQVWSLDVAQHAGGLNADTSFDMEPPRSPRASSRVAPGRAALHPAWRSESVIITLCNGSDSKWLHVDFLGPRSGS